MVVDACVFTVRDWVKADVFQRLFDAVSNDPDMGYAMADTTVVKVYRYGRRKRGIPSQVIGKSRCGMTSKTLVLTDILGNLVRFVLLPGQRRDQSCRNGH
ncbi:hypothetical protein Q6A51_00265 [Pseudomonas sp. KFB-139]|uniref:Transposase n=1 Tax=Pseudomonas serbiensis TaxID=3064350 RepID=A0ABT9CM41_9PSED|nr:hypothetical protein [Pseudomonas sp. KFB-138]MDO7925191.1 hypothetical protein [Pseudomonas sp. KFB-138]